MTDGYFGAIMPGLYVSPNLSGVEVLIVRLNIPLPLHVTGCFYLHSSTSAQLYNGYFSFVSYIVFFFPLHFLIKAVLYFFYSCVEKYQMNACQVSFKERFS